MFDAKRGPKSVDPSSSSDRLYSEIGRLKMELDWLKKKSGICLVENRKQWVSPLEALAITRQCELAGANRSMVYAPSMVTIPDEQELAILSAIDAEYTLHPFYRQP